MARLSWMVSFVLLLILVGRLSAADPSASSLLGRKVPDVALTDFRGANVSLAEFRDKPLVVLAFLGTECPLARLAVPKLNALHKEFDSRGVAVLGVNANRQDSLAELAAQAKEQGIEFRLLKDAGQKLADAAGAERTPQVIVLDRERAVRYVGRIDDQDGIGFRRDAAKRHDLKIAIEELLADKPVSVPVTDIEGCHIGRVREAKSDGEVTYSKQIARILQDRCVVCHRPGQVGPFAMTNYDEVVGWAETIAEVVKDNRMPPWHASPDHGQFANARNLPSDEKQLILDWVKAGAPAGNLNELPPPKTFVDGWQLSREPDAIVTMREQPYAVPASGTVRYQYFSVDPKFTEDKWVTAAELQPGNRGVVHHILVFAKTEGELKKFDGDGSFLAAYVPGFLPQTFPAGMAKLIPAGAKLVFQIHYTPNGQPADDLSRIGLLFAKPDDITHAVITSEARQSRELVIPPKAANHRLQADSPKSPVEVQLLNLMPHMHVRGKSFKCELKTADGKSQTLLDVPRYDFNWQTSYQLAEPMTIPAGSQLHCVAHFDNSENNRNNPNPNATVRWGEQTWDEMLIGYFDIAVPRAVLDTAAEVTAKPDDPKAAARREQLGKVLRDLDKNKDGKITLNEVPEPLKPLFKRIDTNKDGTLSIDEVRQAIQASKAKQ